MFGGGGGEKRFVNWVRRQNAEKLRSDVFVRFYQFFPLVSNIRWASLRVRPLTGRRHRDESVRHCCPLGDATNDGAVFFVRFRRYIIRFCFPENPKQSPARPRKKLVLFLSSSYKPRSRPRAISVYRIYRRYHICTVRWTEPARVSQ